MSNKVATQVIQKVQTKGPHPQKANSFLLSKKKGTNYLCGINAKFYVAVLTAMVFLAPYSLETYLGMTKLRIYDKIQHTNLPKQIKRT